MSYTFSVCPYCSCGCGVLLETRDGLLVGTHPCVGHPSSSGSLCMRGWNAVEAPTHPDRIREPLVRKDGQLVPATPETAMKAIAQELSGLRAKGSPSILFCLGPTGTNEDAYAVKRLARQLNARVSPSDLAGFPAARSAIRRVFGRAYLPSGLDSVDHADQIWIFGADPRSCPQVASRLQAAIRRGAKVVQFDIFSETVNGVPLQPVAVPPEHFGVLPLLLQKAAFEADRIPAPVKAVPSFAPFATAWQPEKAPPLPGHPWLPDARLKELVGAFLNAKQPAAIIGERWLSAVGAGEGTVQLLQALALLGAQERMVLMAGEVNSWGTWDILAPERQDSDALLDLLDPAGTRTFDAIFIIGEDLLRRTSQPGRLAERLGQSKLVVLIDRFHSGTESCAQVVLPSVAFAELDGTTTSMFGDVQRRSRAIEPLAAAAAERDWIARIGQQLGIAGWPGSPVEWFAALQKETASYQATALARLFTEPTCTRMGLEEQTRLTLYPPRFAAPGLASKEFPWSGAFGAHPAVWSTGTMSEREQALRREVNQSELHVSPADLAKIGLRAGAPVKVIAGHAAAQMTAVEDRRLPAGVLLSVPLPGSPAWALRGFFPDADGQSVGIQPVPVRLDKV